MAKYTCKLITIFFRDNSKAKNNLNNQAYSLLEPPKGPDLKLFRKHEKAFILITVTET
jgi:hypothetical protein